MHNPSQLYGETATYALRALAANGFGDAVVGRAEQRFFLSGDRFDQGAREHRASGLTQIVEAKLRNAGAVARRMVAGWKRRQEARAIYFALRELDARTLRDIGLDSSEIMSVAAELAGDADPTRVHTLQARRGRSF